MSPCAALCDCIYLNKCQCIVGVIVIVTYCNIVTVMTVNISVCHCEQCNCIIFADLLSPYDSVFVSQWDSDTKLEPWDLSCM